MKADLSKSSNLTKTEIKVPKINLNFTKESIKNRQTNIKRWNTSIDSSISTPSARSFAKNTIQTNMPLDLSLYKLKKENFLKSTLELKKSFNGKLTDRVSLNEILVDLTAPSTSNNTYEGNKDKILNDSLVVNNNSDSLIANDMTSFLEGRILRLALEEVSENGGEKNIKEKKSSNLIEQFSSRNLNLLSKDSCNINTSQLAIDFEKLTDNINISNNNITDEREGVNNIINENENYNNFGGYLGEGDYIYDGSIKIVKYLAEGAQAKIYIGLIEEIGKYVAIKRYNVGNCEQNFIDKISSEFENIKELDHNNIIKYFDVEFNESNDDPLNKSGTSSTDEFNVTNCVSHKI